MRLTLAFAACIVAFAAGIPCVAGTTGSMSGIVVDGAAHTPIASARVAAVSPSQASSTTTDASGHFYFASLAPDSYVVTVEAPGYEPASIDGALVQADQAQALPAFAMRKALRTVGRITARSAADLVRPGTTIDVYSVTPAQAEAAQALGGGGSLNNAYSALAAVPGLFIPPEQQGSNQSVFIRGGYYDQIGYEYDGVPVNRSFDNYPGGTATNLGQQELQAYTGGGTAGASAVGLSGFINQVIKTGTYPGFATLDGDVGTPTFYHKLEFEFGGATPSRNFSYYGGISGYNQDYRYLSQFNGADLTAAFPYATGPSNQTTFLIYYPAVYPACVGPGGVTDPFDLPPGTKGYLPLPKGVANDPGCYSTISPVYASPSTIRGREAVANLHEAIPHHAGSGKDDLQLLYSSSSELRQFYSSIDDAGAATVQALDGPITWPDYLTFAPGTTFGEPAANAQVVPYLYPTNPHNVGSLLPPDYRGNEWTNSAVVKLQYQRNFSSRAYLRVFGYTFYSDTARTDPNRRAIGSGFGATNYDYEVDSHTRGTEAQFADQFDAHNQVLATLNTTTATTNRYNNTNYDNTGDFGVSNLTNGVSCYAWYSGVELNGTHVGAGQQAPCNDPITQGDFVLYGGPRPTKPNGTPWPIVGAAAAAGATFQITYTGQQGFRNDVQPIFASAAIEDLIKPNDKLTIRAGIRFERDQFDLASTQDAGTDFWFRAAQNEFCYDPLTLAPVLVPVPVAQQALAAPFVGLTCPSPAQTHTQDQTVHPDGKNGHLLLSNVYSPTEVDEYFLPRVGLTYALSADTVLRASAGRYAQGPQNYETQYAAKQENLASALFEGFWQYGFTTPRHDPLPQYSNDFDLSYERHIRGTDMSLSATPYYRYATNQLYGVSAAGLSASLNTGIMSNTGVEFAFTKGDFSKNGWSGRFSYTYLSSTERYANYPNTSVNPVDVYNQYIQEFDALTKAGGGAACYAGAAIDAARPKCPPDSIRNPYFAMAPEPLLDRNGWYQTGLDYPWNVPHAFALIGNYRHDRLALAPAVTVNAGTWYGNPADVIGIDPRTCFSNSRGLTGSPISKQNPLQADYTSCSFAATPSGNLYIPNPETGHFDGFGAFQQPWQLNVNFSASYELTKKVRANLILSNLWNTCFGGSNTPWSRAYPPNSYTCGYYANPFYVANFYNGTSPNDIGANGVPLNPYFKHSFIPSWADQTSLGYVMPFNAYLQFTIKL
jgi:hypothetical protein